MISRLIKKTARITSLFLFDKKLPSGLKKPINHILLINWHGRIGDAIVSSFFYREVRKLDNITISVITTKELETLYREEYKVDNIFIVDSKINYFDLFTIAKKIKNVDTVVPLMGYLNMKNLFFISRINPNNLFSLDDELGFSNIQMGKRTNEFLMHEIFYFILKELGVSDINDKYIIPKVNNNYHIKYDFVFNSFASRLDKSFSIEKSVDILTMIANNYNDKTVGVLSSPNTKKIAYQIVKMVNHKNISLVEEIDSFYDAISIIKLSDMIISIDTSIVHIASGLNKKLIAIYYKQGNLPNAWLPKKSQNTRIIFSLGTKEYKIKNMNNFNTNDMIKAIDSLGIF